MPSCVFGRGEDKYLPLFYLVANRWQATIGNVEPSGLQCLHFAAGIHTRHHLTIQDKATRQGFERRRLGTHLNEALGFFRQEYAAIRQALRGVGVGSGRGSFAVVMPITRYCQRG